MRHPLPERFISLLILTLICIIAPVVIRADVVHGVKSVEPTERANWGQWSHDAFDFDTQTVVTTSSAAADLIYGEDEKGSGWWFQLYYCQGAVLYNTTLEQVLTAPDALVELGGAWLSSQVADTRIFVIKTDDDIYAKFAVHHVYDGINGNGVCCTMEIEYYVQTDGSPSFGPTVATQPTTWGRVKALYR